jgi:hypothetical protein
VRPWRAPTPPVTHRTRVQTRNGAKVAAQSLTSADIKGTDIDGTGGTQAALVDFPIRITTFG